MGKEIERKYLVNLSTWTPQNEGTHFKQGYLNSQKERVVRVRIEGTKAKLTIKGVTTGVTRSEFEYEIPVDEAAILADALDREIPMDLPVGRRTGNEHQLLPRNRRRRQSAQRRLPAELGGPGGDGVHHHVVGVTVVAVPVVPDHGVGVLLIQQVGDLARDEGDRPARVEALRAAWGLPDSAAGAGDLGKKRLMRPTHTKEPTMPATVRARAAPPRRGSDCMSSSLLPTEMPRAKSSSMMAGVTQRVSEVIQGWPRSRKPRAMPRKVSPSAINMKKQSPHTAAGRWHVASVFAAGA